MLDRGPGPVPRVRWLGSAGRRRRCDRCCGRAFVAGGWGQKFA